MEILAPCGDGESFLAAINNGADAIYLGLGDFNARAKSTFFNTENIRDYIKRAHLFGVKVYITTNTLLFDDEIDNFINFIQKCVEAKADAYIIQDWAVARILRDCFDGLELHASTQLGIHNLSGAKIAKDFGFKRVVLSREAKLEDIKEIKENTGLEIEYFVQGALCVAFSGNCYLSALEHNKSGNRGKCLQLCRLPYQAYIDNNLVGNGYLLSARDLCLIENLQELQNAGVDSLKIEGRLRRAGYVAQSVQSYRRALDALNQNKSLNIEKEKFLLKQVFSRGEFNTRAYLDAGVPDQVINPQIQNHLGIKIGQVVSVQNFKDLYKVQIKTNTPIHSGDGLKFLDETNIERASIGIGNVEILGNGNFYIYTKSKLKSNWTIYRTLDSIHEKRLQENIRKLDINAIVHAKENEPLKIEFLYNKNNQIIQAEITSDYICPSAKNAPTTEEEIENQISKLNDTDFILENVDIRMDNVFIPKSILNQARRECISMLEQNIIKTHEKNLKHKVFSENIAFLRDLLSTMHSTMQSNLNNIVIINEDVNLDKISINDNDILAIEPIVYSKQNVLKVIESARHKSKNIALVLPIIANYKDQKIIDEIVDNIDNNIALIINNTWGLKYIKTHKIIAGLGMNVHNLLCANTLKEMGVSDIIFSKEITHNYAGFYHFTFGKHSLMTFVHCPFKTLFNNECKQCKFSKNLKIQGENGRVYEVHRTTISQCYFTLYSNAITNKQTGTGDVLDLRFVDV